MSKKDLIKAMRKLDKIESPDTFQLAPEVSEHVGTVISVLKHLGGEAEFVFGPTRYRLTLAESKVRPKTKPKRSKNAK